MGKLYLIVLCGLLNFMALYAAVAPVATPTPLFQLTYRDGADRPRITYIWASAHNVSYKSFPRPLRQKIKELLSNPNIMGVFEVDFSHSLEETIQEILRLYSAESYRAALQLTSNLLGEDFSAWQQWEDFYARRIFPLIRRKLDRRYHRQFAAPLHPRICWRLLTEGYSFQDIGSHSDGADHAIYERLIKRHRPFAYLETEEERSQIEWPEAGRGNYLAFKHVVDLVIARIEERDREKVRNPIRKAERKRLKKEVRRRSQEQSYQDYLHALRDPLAPPAVPDASCDARTHMWTARKLPPLLNDPHQPDRILLIVVGADHVVGPQGLLEWFRHTYPGLEIRQYYERADHRLIEQPLT